MDPYIHVTLELSLDCRERPPSNPPKVVGQRFVLSHPEMPTKFEWVVWYPIRDGRWIANDGWRWWLSIHHRRIEKLPPPDGSKFERLYKLPALCSMQEKHVRRPIDQSMWITTLERQELAVNEIRMIGRSILERSMTTIENRMSWLGLKAFPANKDESR